MPHKFVRNPDRPSYPTVRCSKCGFRKWALRGREIVCRICGQKLTD